MAYFIHFLLKSTCLEVYKIMYPHNVNCFCLQNSIYIKKFFRYCHFQILLSLKKFKLLMCHLETIYIFLWQLALWGPLHYVISSIFLWSAEAHSSEKFYSRIFAILLHYHNSCNHLIWGFHRMFQKSFRSTIVFLVKYLEGLFILKMRGNYTFHVLYSNWEVWKAQKK